MMFNNKIEKVFAYELSFSHKKSGVVMPVPCDYGQYRKWTWDAGKRLPESLVVY